MCNMPRPSRRVKFQYSSGLSKHLQRTGLFSTSSKIEAKPYSPQQRGVKFMPQFKTSVSHRVLLVDDDEAVREMMGMTLESKGFNVTSAASVTAALKLIATEPFDVLITDLHMPNPSDGFAVVSAMRQTQPDALTLLVSGYPDVQSAMDAIILQADDILVKPFDVRGLAELLHQKMENRKPAVRSEKERVASILQRCTIEIVQDWLLRVKRNKALIAVSLSD